MTVEVVARAVCNVLQVVLLDLRLVVFTASDICGFRALTFSHCPVGDCPALSRVGHISLDKADICF